MIWSCPKKEKTEVEQYEYVKERKFVRGTKSKIIEDDILDDDEYLEDVLHDQENNS